MKSTDERLRDLAADLASDIECDHVDIEAVRWAVTIAQETRAMLSASHGAVDSAARHHRKIGYDDGYSTGYDDACQHHRGVTLKPLEKGSRPKAPGAGNMEAAGIEPAREYAAILPVCRRNGCQVELFFGPGADCSRYCSQSKGTESASAEAA